MVRCDKEVLQLEEEEETEDMEQCLDEKNCTGIEGATPTLKWRRVGRDASLAASLSSGHHHEYYLGIHGPSQALILKASSPFDFQSLLWPASVCAVIALETNRYACQKGALNRHNTGTPKIWTFLGVIFLMGIKKLPQIQLYWTSKDFVSVPILVRYTSKARFWSIWRYQHVTQGTVQLRGSIKLNETSN